MGALMNSHSGDVEEISFLIDEGAAMNISVMPPDINESFDYFTVIPTQVSEGMRIRFGLLSIKNVGENIVKAIIEERKRNGKFISLEDFISRVQHKDLNPERNRELSSATDSTEKQRASVSYGMNKKSLESLIKCGALDSL